MEQLLIAVAIWFIIGCIVLAIYLLINRSVIIEAWFEFGILGSFLIAVTGIILWPLVMRDIMNDIRP